MVKKFTTFEDLKFSEGKTMDDEASIKKHIKFEGVIKAIYSIKVHKNVIPKSQ